MAATALLTVKPFTSIANSISPITGVRINNNSLVLAHTGNSMGAASGNIIRQISNLKNSHSNLIMLHAGETSPALQPVYDASLHHVDGYSIAATDYKIIYKGDIKTGIIYAINNAVSAERINALAIYLKKEKNCQLVVCLSQLGYRSEKGLNDYDLAKASTHLDVIIGGHETDFCARPVIAQNKNKEEVIINHAATNGFALRKIEIGFDNRGKKDHVAFTKAC
jgi:hypothetical protein